MTLSRLNFRMLSSNDAQDMSTMLEMNPCDNLPKGHLPEFDYVPRSKRVGRNVNPQSVQVRTTQAPLEYYDCPCLTVADGIHSKRKKTRGAGFTGVCTIQTSKDLVYVTVGQVCCGLCSALLLLLLRLCRLLQLVIMLVHLISSPPPFSVSICFLHRYCP